jgi:hypothetical protein
MSDSTTIDRPGLDPAKFAATLVETPGLEHTLTVTGEASGDYRVQKVELVRAAHQHSKHTLALDVVATLGPAENPHPEFIRPFPLTYRESPAAHHYNHVVVSSGPQHFTITVEDVL